MFSCLYSGETLQYPFHLVFTNTKRGAWLRKQHPGWITTVILIIDLVSVAVAFIPEGLPIAVTASLTIVANIMRKNDILCKSLATVETLGCVNLILSDKTGTLTKNQMFVTDISLETFEHTPESLRDKMVLDNRDQESKGVASASPISQLRIIGGLCNAGEFDAATVNLPLEQRNIHGDATDQAVLRLSEHLGSVSDLRKDWKKTFEMPFNSKNKFMVKIMTPENPNALEAALPTAEMKAFGNNDNLLMIKGAPDILWDRCNHITASNGTTQVLDFDGRATLESIKNRWSSEGKRVLLLARKTIPAQKLKSVPGTSAFDTEIYEHIASDLTLVGLVGIVDPPRDEIPEVVRVMRRAGIRFFMVTGDFKLTAQAIAAQVGIITNNNTVDDVSALNERPSDKFQVENTSDDEKVPKAIAISGSELMDLDDDQWDHLATYDEVVFARTTPEQKLRIVKEFQARDDIVAMTGDGVNDAPSLKAADVGIALGSGSAIAIEAADMVLLDSFAAIVEAVKYGRLVYDNLKKTIIYLLPAGSFSELSKFSITKMSDIS
jgi:sodium/potassium-transporting ATPase subunit alpha